MTNDELKKKICEIIDSSCSFYCGSNVHMDDEQENAIADALIAAGIVDKSDYASMKETAVRYKAEVSKAGAREKEAEHRAEVAEREAIILSQWLADKTRKNYPYQAWLEAAQKQAKKELAEEREDD